MKDRRIIFLLAVIFSLGAGCSYHFRRVLPVPPPDLEGIKVVAVAPLTNLTTIPDAGLMVAEFLNLALTAQGLYSLIDADSVNGAIPEEEKGTLVDRVRARTIGEVLNADAVIYGVVTEYWYQEDMKYYPDREPALGISARLVEVKSGAVIGAVSVSRTGGGAFKYLFSDNRGNMSNITRQASEEVINALLPFSKRR